MVSRPARQKLNRWLTGLNHATLAALGLASWMTMGPTPHHHTALAPSAPVYNGQQLQRLLDNRTADQFVDMQLQRLASKKASMEKRGTWNNTYEKMEKLTQQRLQLFRDPDAMAARILNPEQRLRFQRLSTAQQLDLLAGTFTLVHEAGGERVPDVTGDTSLGQAFTAVVLINRVKSRRGGFFEQSTDFAQFSFWSAPRIQLANLATADKLTQQTIEKAVAFTSAAMSLTWNQPMEDVVLNASLQEARDVIGDAEDYCNLAVVDPVWRKNLEAAGKVPITAGRHTYWRTPAPEASLTR